MLAVSTQLTFAHRKFAFSALEIWHTERLPVQITVRGVPEEVRDALAAKAALKRQSMQEFLSVELERIAMKPSVETLLQAIRHRKEATGTRLSSEKILSARDADRV